VPSSAQLEDFGSRISTLWFELIEDKTARIISQVKNAVLHYVRENPAARKVKFSVFLADRLAKDYNYLSNLFSETEGTTIEQYLIHQKIEYVKELLVYDELSLSEIAHQLGYSSVQHLSNQFKKVTGLTPSHFKQVKENKRKPLDKI
jgi:AraC family transcriptional regulator